MMFDNSTQPQPSTRTTVRRHLPLAVGVGAALAIFVGLHTAATTLVAVGAVHLLAVGLIVGVRQLHAGRDEASQ